MFITAVAYAYQENAEVSRILGKVADALVNPAIYLIFGIALVVFLWGVFEYFFRSDDSAAREQGSRHILWGIIGMAIMFSVYGILSLIGATIGVPVQ